MKKYTFTYTTGNVKEFFLSSEEYAEHFNDRKSYIDSVYIGNVCIYSID